MSRETPQAASSGARQDGRRRRVLSGIQPSGALHIGNYVGAIRQWVRGQDRRENFICIVDLHAITVTQEPATLERRTRELAALLFACGIDPARTTLFVQSHVRAHAEAAWILGCVTPLGWLERMTQYKAKAQQQKSVSTGLLTYPVLQTADILLYDADEVPVGEDQKQHIELARDIALRFNQIYGETFVVPEGVIPEIGARVMGFDDPTQKMSKSGEGRDHAVLLTDPDDRIDRILRRAVTDSGRDIVLSDAPEKAGVRNLLTLYQALTERSRAEVEADFADARGYGELKQRVAEVVIETVRPIRQRFEALYADEAELDRLLAVGAEAARAVAEPKIELVKERVGFLPARKT
ncbi:MAG TPA: tryptophan--tRNA ligase [Thermoanaerobaculia bacterium]|nr:tryptophan--tRNA ligase [Thermoanaerobaculia bacterium]